MAMTGVALACSGLLGSSPINTRNSSFSVSDLLYSP